MNALFSITMMLSCCSGNYHESKTLPTAPEKHSAKDPKNRSTIVGGVSVTIDLGKHIKSLEDQARKILSGDQETEALRILKALSKANNKNVIVRPTCTWVYAKAKNKTVPYLKVITFPEPDIPGPTLRPAGHCYRLKARVTEVDSVERESGPPLNVDYVCYARFKLSLSIENTKTATTLRLNLPAWFYLVPTKNDIPPEEPPLP